MYLNVRFRNGANRVFVCGSTTPSNDHGYLPFLPYHGGHRHQEFLITEPSKHGGRLYNKKKNPLPRVVAHGWAANYLTRELIRVPRVQELRLGYTSLAEGKPCARGQPSRGKYKTQVSRGTLETLGSTFTNLTGEILPRRTLNVDGPCQSHSRTGRIFRPRSYRFLLHFLRRASQKLAVTVLVTL